MSENGPENVRFNRTFFVALTDRIIRVWTRDVTRQRCRNLLRAGLKW